MGLLARCLYNNVFLSLKIVFILVNSADPDEMPPYAAFHLGLYCLWSTCLQVSWMKRDNYPTIQSVHDG